MAGYPPWADQERLRDLIDPVREQDRPVAYFVYEDYFDNPVGLSQGSRRQPREANAVISERHWPPQSPLHFPYEPLPASPYREHSTHNRHRPTSSPLPSSPPLPPAPEMEEPNSFGYMPDNFFPSSPPGGSSPTISPESRSFWQWSSPSLMPPHRRNQGPSETVDLTGDPSSPPAAAASPSQTRKRRRSEQEPSSSSPARPSTRRRERSATAGGEKEEAGEENKPPSAEADLLAATQMSAIAAQEANQPTSQRIGKRTCNICLENYRNFTATACGHVFCHECITQALKASAGRDPNGRGTTGGNCPNCRFTISKKKKDQVIPVAFMTKRGFKKNQRAREALNG